MSPKTRRNISRIIPFGVIWFFFGNLYALLERGLLGDLQFYPSTGNPYDFSGSFLFHIIFETAVGLVFGTIEVLYMNKLFIHRTFSAKIIAKTTIYIGIMIVFLVVVTVGSNAFILNAGIFDRQVWNNVLKFSSTFSFWSVELYVAAIICLSLLYTEVSDSVGREVLNNFFTGKYHNPLEEERIFMFVDMKSSTTIAEKLGHVKYFELLKEYYENLSDPIMNFRGEIYQYVGDEIVVSWTVRNGFEDNNCLRCFLAMKEAIKNRSSYYLSSHGLVPSFKAGFHLGEVTTGEIGVVKKHILFTGDVLNTTSRIQGLCNAYDVDNLISGTMVERMNADPDFTLEALGENDLRGRNEKVKLYTLR